MPQPARPAPFSLRLTPEERSTLEAEAGTIPLGAYIKWRLLNSASPPPRHRGLRPVKDHAALAQVLGVLGQTRIAANINQLAKAANTGSLPVTPDTQAALLQAVSDIADLRRLLLQALNLEGGV